MDANRRGTTVDVDLPAERLSALVGAIVDVARSGVWGTESTHPWRDFVVDGSVVAAREPILSALADLGEAARAAMSAVARCEALLGERVDGRTLAGLPGLEAVAASLANLPLSIRVHWFFAPDDELDRVIALAAEAVAHRAIRSRTASSLRAAEALVLCGHMDVVEDLLPRYRDRYAVPRARLSLAYGRDRRTLGTFLTWVPGYADTLAVLENARECASAHLWLAKAQPILHRIGELPWPAEQGDAEDLVSDLEEVRRLRGLLPRGRLMEKAAAELLDDGHTSRVEAQIACSEIRFARGAAASAVEALAAWLPGGVDGAEPTNVDYEELSGRVQASLAEPERLDEWVAYEQAVERCRLGGLGAFLAEARARGLRAEELPPAFRSMFAARLGGDP